MPTGLYGKLPAHGDFLRRVLPEDFCETWDVWAQHGMAAAREALGDPGFDSAWQSAPAWRFLLPEGACGAARIAGLMMPSADLVGRRFPLTLAAPVTAEAPAEAWFDTLHDLARQAITAAQTADALADALPEPWPAPWPTEAPMPEGWWLAPSHHWPLAALPPPAMFRILLEGGG